MIVDDLHLVGVAITPDEADPPLRVDANAVLPPTSPNEFLETGGWHTQILRRFGRVEEEQLPKGSLSQRPRKPLRWLAAEEVTRVKKPCCEGPIQLGPCPSTAELSPRSVEGQALRRGQTRTPTTAHSQGAEALV